MPKPGPAVTVAEICDWTAEIAGGGTIRAIAARTGRAPATIARHLPVSPTGGAGRGRRITDEQRAAILARHAAGESIHRITQATGHAWGTVQQAITRAVAQGDGEFRAPRASDEPDLPVGGEITLHVTGRVLSCWRGVLVLSVPTAGGTPERLTVDLTAPAVTIRARRW